ncbi:hypothetical protein SBA1_90068 [Candidatus Sulfotelmatobacter kueseliae]|uniref:Uncharacterized protein n=1 Tax=Candidatus Sulfotelmatobacter kueseliae TaxID=2042962 RepID=A0A2U3LAL7_9BACT|nr:hypothetical protein SBA1_90068 [Candidatus Sulfotelmatobacter kueseliae]
MTRISGAGKEPGDLKPSSAQPHSIRLRGGRWRLLLGLRRGRKQAAEAQIHGRRAVVVGPVVGEGDQGEGARAFVAAEQFHFVGELGVIHFVEGGGAEVETRLQRLDQFVLAVGFLQRHGGLDLRQVADFRAQIIVRLHDVQDEVAEGHLLLGGLVGKLVGGHFLDRGDQVLLLARENFPDDRSHRIFVLRQNRGCGEKQKNNECAFHGKPPGVAVPFYSGGAGSARDPPLSDQNRRGRSGSHPSKSAQSLP